MRVFYPGTQQQHQTGVYHRVYNAERKLNEALLCQMRILYQEDPDVTPEFLGRRFALSPKQAEKYLHVLEEELFPWEDEEAPSDHI